MDVDNLDGEDRRCPGLVITIKELTARGSGTKLLMECGARRKASMRVADEPRGHCMIGEAIWSIAGASRRPAVETCSLAIELNLPAHGLIRRFRATLDRINGAGPSGCPPSSSMGHFSDHQPMPAIERRPEQAARHGQLGGNGPVSASTSSISERARAGRVHPLVGRAERFRPGLADRFGAGGHMTAWRRCTRWWCRCVWRSRTRRRLMGSRGQATTARAQPRRPVNGKEARRVIDGVSPAKHRHSVIMFAGDASTRATAVGSAPGPCRRR